MVSLFNSDQIRLRLNHSEVMTQFPNYLYDPYAYPSNLNSMDYHWNLFYPQNHYAIQNKRKKKLKEQLANERVFKDIMPSFEYKKEEVLDWLKSLTVKDRLRVFSINNNWLAATFLKMYQRWSDSNNIVFAQLLDSKKQIPNHDSLELNDLEKEFYCRRKPAADEIPQDKKVLIDKAEQELIENIRIYDSTELYDTLVPTESFVSDIDNISALFELLSDGLAFTKPCKLAYDHQRKCVVWDTPLWFSSNSFQTFSAWIVSNLERAVWMRYFEEKKGGLKTSTVNDPQIDLNYKRNLIEFYKSLETNKKKKILTSISETYKTLTNEKTKSEDKESKDLDQKLRLLYNTLYSNKTDIAAIDDINNQFQALFEGDNDDEIMNKILLTSFEEFGTLNNLICRKITHKLKSMLSDKIATDLILTEEKEKGNNKKKNLKKKKNAKKSNKEIIVEHTLIHDDEDDECNTPVDVKIEQAEEHLILTETNSTPKKSPNDDKDGDRKLSFGIDLSHRHHDEVSTEHSIEEQKKDEAEFKLTPSNKTWRKNSSSNQLTDIAGRHESPKRLKSHTFQGVHKDQHPSLCSSVETKCSGSEEEDIKIEGQRYFIQRNTKTPGDRKESHQKKQDKPIIQRSNRNINQNKAFQTIVPVAKAEVDTTDSESGILNKETEHENTKKPRDDNFSGFIEVRPRKKSVTRNKKEVKEPFNKKRRDQNYAESAVREKPKVLVETNKTHSKPLIIEPKRVDENKKIESPQTAPLKTSSSTTTPKVTLPEKSTTPAPVSTIPTLSTSESVNKTTPNVTNVTTTPAPQEGGIPLLLQRPAQPKFPRTGKLRLTSQPLDFDAIQLSKAKDLAKEFFDAKLERDIYEHVKVLTEGSNKLIKSRILVYKRIEHCVARTFPSNNMKTKIFGSCATGLALTTSDVDIAVSGIETYDRATLCDSLTQISEVLKSFKWVLSNKPILTAHVPVLKLEIDPQVDFNELVDAGLIDDTKMRVILSGQGPELNLTEDGEKAVIKVDLTLESLGMMGYTVHMGYRSTEFAEKMLAQYKSLYIVTIVLKEFLYNRKLLNTFQGGLSSYCLVLLIVALLQKHGDEGYMKVLRRFLKFYGEGFQPEKTGITLCEPDPFFDLNHSYETAPLWILDHNNYVDRRNIGQGAYSIKLILHEFEKTSNLIDYLQQKCEEIIVKHKGKIHTVDDIWLLEDPELKAFCSSNIIDSFISCT